MLSSWNNLFQNINFNETLNSVLQDTICPNEKNIFKCFSYFDVLDTRVIICGQDPYHTKNVATGLAFEDKQVKQPSLRNIFKEVKRCYPDSKCDIESWCKQGVLMLNRALTVKLNKPNSHTKYWKKKTNEMIKVLSEYSKENNHKLIFMLWGNNAQELQKYIDTDYHIILKHTHPSPLSRKPFVGNDHFVICNDYLENKIIW